MPISDNKKLIIALFEAESLSDRLLMDISTEERSSSKSVHRHVMA
jgi:hypothetical protein